MANEGNEASAADDSEIENPGTELDSSTTSLVKERYEVLFDTPIPQLDSNGAVAYKIIDKINTKRNLFALICSNEIPPRASILPYLKSIEHPNIMKLVEFGIVDYIKAGSRNVVLIYEQPMGGRVSDFQDSDLSYKTNPDKFKSNLMSLFSAVETLRGFNITHRAIRADNVYYKDEARTEIVFGDCAAAFPAFYQDARSETIESAYAMPEGRGNGNSGNDVYAVGVLILNLITHKISMNGLSNEEVLRIKIRKGSYGALTSEDRIPNTYIPLLKGLLSDSEDQRWSYQQAFNFMEGKPVSFGTPVGNEKPLRSLTINGEKVYTAQSAAIALLNSHNEAFDLIKSGKITEWVKNGLENDKVCLKIDKFLKTDAENFTDNNNVVSKVCIFLNPQLPIKFKDLILFPDGAPKAIFYALKKQQNIGELAEFFSSDLIKLWYQEQENLRSPANVAEFKIYVTRKDFGYGIDRIMYDFDEDLPCTSPLLGNEFVNTASKVLRALDNNYAKNKLLGLPYDRNLIAFLRCKMGKKIDGIITDLNSNKESVQNAAIVRLFTNMQNKFGPAQLPNLAKWLINISKSIINSYHNVKYQKYLEKELFKISKNGKLMEICDTLENEEARTKDKNDYAAAINEINYLLSEKSKLVVGGSKLDEEATKMAFKFASVLAILTMVMSFIFNLIYWVTK